VANKSLNNESASDLLRKNSSNRQREESDQEGWMVAYADMITLLFIFFTLLLSISTVNTTKFDLMRTEVNKQSSSDLAKIAEDVNKEIAQKNLKDLVSVEMSAEGLRIAFSEKVLFASGASQLNGEGEQVLNGVTSVIKNVNHQYQIAIEGHTDSIPIHTKEFSSNWVLSSSRAVNVLHFLMEHGVSDRIMSVRGYADTRPLADQKNIEKPSTETSMSKNRRVSLLIY
jgi:chemotaxis protein MotB